MIQMQTRLEVADNSGALIVQCIKVLGGSKKMHAMLGETIVVSVKKAQPRGKVKAGDISLGVIVRVKKGMRRPDGSTIRFDSNAIVLINKQGEPIGTRVTKPVARDELRIRQHNKILSLAPEAI